MDSKEEWEHLGPQQTVLECQEAGNEGTFVPYSPLQQVKLEVISSERPRLQSWHSLSATARVNKALAVLD